MDRARALGRLKFSDNGFRLLTLGSAVLVLVLLLGVMVSLFIGAWPAFREFGVGFLFSDAWSSAQREIRRGDGDLRHPRHLVDRHADRRSGRPWHRGVPDGALLGAPASADRRRDRAPRRNSLDHLRHLGRLLFPAGDAGLYPALPHQHARQRAGHRLFVCWATAGLWRADRGARARADDPALHHRGVAGCLRHRPGRAQGGRLRRRRDDLRGRRQHRHSLTPGSA